MAKPRMRCRVCRMWIDCNPQDTTLPEHYVHGTTMRCGGSGQYPAGRRGPAD